MEHAFFTLNDTLREMVCKRLNKMISVICYYDAETH